MFELDGYKVYFSYDREQRITRCEIKSGDTLVSWGETVCHPTDNFEKNSGRKRAMGRAFQLAHFNKEFRTKMWEKYFERRGKIN